MRRPARVAGLGEARYQGRGVELARQAVDAPAAFLGGGGGRGADHGEAQRRRQSGAVLGDRLDSVRAGEHQPVEARQRGERAVRAPAGRRAARPPPPASGERARRPPGGARRAHRPAARRGSPRRRDRKAERRGRRRASRLAGSGSRLRNGAVHGLAPSGRRMLGEDRRGAAGDELLGESATELLRPARRAAALAGDMPAAVDRDHFASERELFAGERREGADRHLAAALEARRAGRARQRS